jgi:hypothetical protein
VISHFANIIVVKVVIPKIEVPRPKVGSKGIKRKSGRAFPTKAWWWLQIRVLIFGKYTILYKSIL